MKFLVYIFSSLYAFGYSQSNNNSSVEKKSDNNQYVDEKPLELLDNTNEILINVRTNEKAEFKGGQSAFLEYINENLKLPLIVKEGKVSGACYIEVIINKNGEIEQSKITTPLSSCSECNHEALRIVKSMPNWKPAKNNGKLVKVSEILRISFTVNK